MGSCMIGVRLVLPLSHPTKRQEWAKIRILGFRFLGGMERGGLIGLAYSYYLIYGVHMIEDDVSSQPSMIKTNRDH